ncbi:hypothetical protein VSU16_16010 (plasmid) [Cetobacterium somerae]|uniref:hypothetical protein n=1 Tax=Cetobacterium somerae TaxID=188913 RepID=UPI002E7BC7F5|nr:hypothetical protein [Cetobacterium somerae]WVJ03333.1 hypothetical protein VSU16_16010 [Cetobacterium somerae]
MELSEIKIFFLKEQTPNLQSVEVVRKIQSGITSKSLLEIRKIWEDLQNKYLENANVNERVSCETLEKQREIALERGDYLLAESLDRNPIHINGALLKKKI